jgi:DNA polymerase III epsilon subunit-like protein
MIVLDVESTGLDFKKNSILSLGALDLNDPTNQFYEECRVWDGAHIEDTALAINGFSREQAMDPAKQDEAELIEAFIAWAMDDRIADKTLAAQNVAFDHGMVEAACQRAGIEFPFAKRVIDTHTLCWGHMTARGITPPLMKHHSALNLTAVLAYCGLPEEPKPHNALTGAFCHAECIARMAYTKKLLPEFDAYDIPWLNQ